MRSDDLMRMLDMDGGRESGPDPLSIKTVSGEPVAGGKPAAPPSPPSPTALVLDQWAVRKGTDLRRTIHKLAQMELGQHPDLAAADFHAAAFLPDPELTENCTDKRRGEFMKAMLETPEYKELHASTQLNDLPAELATLHFAEQYAKLLEEDKKREEAQPPAKPGSKEAQRQQMKAEMACLRAAGQAVEKAKQDVEEADEAARSFGRGPGQPGAADTAAIRALFERCRGSAMMKKIIEWAGRFRRVSLSKQSKKVTHGYDDMVGVVTGGDVGRLLPNELAALSDDDLELDALQRIVEREALLWEYRGEEPAAKGPIIILTDESSSMSQDDNLVKSKALALTLAGIARKQKRWCALVGWADCGNYNPLALPPAQWDERKLYAWLEHFYRGGTEPPLKYMSRIYALTKAPVGKTDMVLITDGEFGLYPDEVAGFNEWKKQAQAKLITLCVGTDSAGDAPKVSDVVHMVEGLDATSDAVGSVLSI